MRPCAAPLTSAALPPPPHSRYCSPSDSALAKFNNTDYWQVTILSSSAFHSPPHHALSNRHITDYVGRRTPCSTHSARAIWQPMSGLNTAPARSGARRSISPRSTLCAFAPPDKQCDNATMRHRSTLSHALWLGPQFENPSFCGPLPLLMAMTNLSL